MSCDLLIPPLLSEGNYWDLLQLSFSTLLWVLQQISVVLLCSMRQFTPREAISSRYLPNIIIPNRHCPKDSSGGIAFAYSFLCTLIGCGSNLIRCWSLQRCGVQWQKVSAPLMRLKPSSVVLTQKSCFCCGLAGVWFCFFKLIKFGTDTWECATNIELNFRCALKPKWKYVQSTSPQQEVNAFVCYSGCDFALLL